MKPDIPSVLNRYVEAQNAHDTEALLKCFTDGAVVHDEGRSYRGTAAIRSWSDAVIEKYNLSVEILNAVEHGNETVLEAMVSGTFDGSPAKLTYRFRLSDDGRISALEAG
jgi:ketosteroid isomerase-like protein